MEVRNCKICNKLFQYIGGVPFCPVCREGIEKRFADVKEYIYSNPGVSISEVSEKLDVPVKQIRQWIKEERLMLTAPSPDGVLCEQCGVPICSGRYCASCKRRLLNSLDSVSNHPKKNYASHERKNRDGEKMRFLNEEEE